MKKIGIIGLGYVGAPLAYLTAHKGYNVIGIDNNNDVLEQINNRLNIPKELKGKIKEDTILNLTATNDFSRLIEVDIIIICVPTPTKNNNPDLSILQKVISDMSNYIKNDCLIIVESTVAPGMTRKYVIDYIYENKGLIVNKDYNLAYCPERIDPGNSKYWVGNINRVCGATSQEALNLACEFYKSIIEGKIIPMSSIEEAELVKVWENSMRNISIAQSNLLAIICDKYSFSVKNMLEGLNSKVEQFGISLSYPGIGPGGHCIPEDIHYLIETSQKDINVDMKLLKEAVAINEYMPQYANDKLLRAIKTNNDNIDDMKILMLGVSYKANSSDTRRSQALVLYDIISKINKNVKIYDYKANIKNENTLTEEEFEKYIQEVDVIILGCAHDEFLKIDYTQYSKLKYILDCWNKLNDEEIKKANIKYIGVGI